jgi:hypothetical protein
MSMRLAIKIVDGQTIHVTAMGTGTFQPKPEVLHPGERHSSSLQTYESLRSLAQASPGAEDFEVRCVYHIFKERVPNSDIIRVGPWNPNGLQQSWDVQPGGRAMADCGSLKYDELEKLPDGENYVEGPY